MDEELRNQALYGTPNMSKEQAAYIRLQDAAHRSERYYEKPLLLCYSGGKDSDALVQLAFESGIDFEIVHSHTTADAPETVRYIRERFKEWEGKGINCMIEYPHYKGVRTSMWALIPQKILPPTRVIRYCCEILKETSGDGRACATGIRWAESLKRKQRGVNEAIAKKKEEKIILMNDNDDKRLLNERCMMHHKTICNPIIDWSDAEVRDFLTDRKVEGNPLYKCGFSRVGCIGCPMASKHRWEEFRMFPKYRDLYIKSFNKSLEINKGKKLSFKDGYEMFLWWMEENPDQITFEGFDDWEDEYDG